MALSVEAWHRQMIVEGHASEFLARKNKRQSTRSRVAVIDDEGNDVEDDWYFEPMS